MTVPSQPIDPPQPEGQEEAQENIDLEAAEIDARSPEAPEQIANLADAADELGLATPEPYEVPPPDAQT